MRVTFDWIQLAAAVGAVQGLLLAVVLVAHRTKRTANRLLAALMAAFAIYLIAQVYYSAGMVQVYPHLFGLSYPMPWVFGPLVYLYALAASDTAWRFRTRDLLHFVPVMLVVVATLPIYLMSGPDKIALYGRIQTGNPPTVLAALSPFMYISGLSYSVATVAYLRRHARRVENSYSNTERVNLQWLLRLSGAAAAIWLLALSIRVANSLPEAIPRPAGNLVGLAITLVVYAIGYMGLRQPEIYRYDEPAPVQPPESTTEPSGPSAARYERSGLSAVEAAALKSELVALMAKEHPYRDPDLTLSDLAEQLSTSPHKLSEVLNQELAQTFYDFVNSYRVGDVRQRLVERTSQHLSVLTLALDAGFASKSTFNQVFKKLTGQTPSSYRKALGA